MQSNRTRKRFSRGAVLVEAAVVIPCFIILFGGMLFLHNVLREQQRVGAKAKYDAWTYAMASCHGDGNDVGQPPYSSTMDGAPGADITLQKSIGRAKASSSSTVTVGLPGGGASLASTGSAFSQSVSAHAIVFCNNETESGTMSGVFDWLISNVKDLLGW